MTIETVQSVLTALGWSTLGATVGVMVDRAVFRVPQPRSIPEPPMTTDQAPSPRTRWQRARGIVVPVVLVIFGAISVTETYVGQQHYIAQQEQTRHLVDCLNTYANGIADALDARTSAAADAQAALDHLMDVVADALRAQQQPDREAVQRAIDEYRASRAAARRAQSSHPYPAAPRDVCR